MRKANMFDTVIHVVFAVLLPLSILFAMVTQ